MPRRAILRRAHRVAGLVGFLVILGFWTSTVVVQLFGSADAVVAVKRAIPWGLLILVPALAITGVSGVRMAGRSTHPRIIAKTRRMRAIAAIGIMILTPASVYLAAASRTAPGPGYYTVQAVELVAGGTNLVLMALSIRDGLRLSGRLKIAARSPRSGRSSPAAIRQR